MFEDLTSKNALLFATKFYQNEQCMTMAEFLDDYRRIKYLKRLLRRYVVTGEIKERLVLNHLITLYNVFEPEALTRLLFLKLDPNLYPPLKTYLEFLNYMPSRVPGIAGKTVLNTHIDTDLALLTKLRSL